WDAMQALPPAQRRMDLEIGGDGARCTIRVRDYGCGLDGAQMARLFEAFFTTKPDGLGLGLSICKSIIEAHAGRLVAMRPDEGPGMCFSVNLPAHERTT
ncbi:MAG: ATP-binding protein, partial [Rhodocyclaceae bacterium]